MLRKIAFACVGDAVGDAERGGEAGRRGERGRGGMATAASIDGAAAGADGGAGALAAGGASGLAEADGGRLDGEWLGDSSLTSSTRRVDAKSSDSGGDSRAFVDLGGGDCMLCD